MLGLSFEHLWYKRGTWMNNAAGLCQRLWNVGHVILNSLGSLVLLPDETQYQQLEKRCRICLIKSYMFLGTNSDSTCSNTLTYRNFLNAACTQSAVHVSEDVFAHHLEHLTEFTAFVIVHLCCCRPVSWHHLRGVLVVVILSLRLDKYVLLYWMQCQCLGSSV